MSSMTVIRTIHAPVDTVFKTVSDIKQFSQAVPSIVKVEFLSDVKSGMGTRFPETRLMKGKEAPMVITDFHPILAESSGLNLDSYDKE